MGTTSNYGWDYPESATTPPAVHTWIQSVADDADAELKAVDDRVTALETASGEWDTYTPTVGNLTLGDGTMSAEYRVTNGQASVWWVLDCGTTTSFTSSIHISIPSGLTIKTVAGEYCIEVSGYSRTSAGVVKAVTGRPRSNNSFYPFLIATGGTVYPTNTGDDSDGTGDLTYCIHAEFYVA